MSERLEKLSLIPPPADTPWAGAATVATGTEITRANGEKLHIDVPLFWHDPAWSRVTTGAADVLAVAVAERGVLVSALRSDLSAPDEQPDFHSGGMSDDDGEEGEEDEEERERYPLLRIVPYRPERYGLTLEDFDGANLIDVRLTMNRDAAGRFAFSPEQIERWESTPEGEPLAGGGWVPAATFPPDVESMDHISSKLNQLRSLSPEAAVFVSIGPYRLDDELPAVVNSKPDGIILQLDDANLDGMRLALLTRHARQTLEHLECPELPLWIAPGAISPDDAVKLIALGASAIAIDAWCNEIFDEVENQSQQTSRYSSRSGPNEAQLFEMVEEELAERIERFSGLLHSLQSVSGKDQLGSFHPDWAKSLGVPVLPLISDE